MTRIAISYRRDDSKAASHMLFERLQTVFGKQSVFLDFDSISPGVDFRQHIDETLQRSDVILVMIGSRWLGARPDGADRIDDAADWVRIEVEIALQRKAFVIPVLVDGTPMPAPGQLPKSIRALAFLNALTLDTGIDFAPHTERLVTAIRHRFPTENDVPATHPIATKTAGAAAPPQRRKLLLVAAVAVAVIAVVGSYLFRGAVPSRVATVLHKTGWNAAQGDAANRAKDYDTALQWYRKAADEGNVHAKAQLGVYYHAGLGVDEDDVKAFQWTSEAANEGDVHGMYDLAEDYFFGVGTPRNETQSAVWYRRAADRGSGAAEAALGLAYEDGFGVAKDEALSLQWYQKAASHGNADAEEELGELYSAGHGGVSKDQRMARLWMTKAAQDGHPDAKAWLRDNPEP